jgi:hypothetical protein
MKIIKLTESQFKTILEANGVVAPNFDGGDLKEYPGSEVSTTANVTNQDGELEYGFMPTTDKYANTQTPQNYLANGRLRTRPMP